MYLIKIQVSLESIFLVFSSHFVATFFLSVHILLIHVFVGPYFVGIPGHL